MYTFYGGQPHLFPVTHAALIFWRHSQVSALPFTIIGLHGDRRPDQRLKPRCLFQSDQVVLHVREKSRKTDPGRFLSESIYSRGFGWTDRRKYVPHRQTTEIESLGTLARELTQISHSDASDHNLTSPGAARYFDYESAVALRNLAAARRLWHRHAALPAGPRSGRPALQGARSPQASVHRCAVKYRGAT